MREVKDIDTSNVRPFNGARPSEQRTISPLRPVGVNAGPEIASGLMHSEGGFNFSGVDSLGGPVKGFVQTAEPELAAKELERAGVAVHRITERRGARKKFR